MAGLHRPQPEPRPENRHSPTHLCGSYSQRNLYMFLVLDQSAIVNDEPERKVTPLLPSLSFSSSARHSSQTALRFHFFNQLHDKMIFFFLFHRVQITDGDKRECHLCSFFTEAALPMTSLEFRGLYLSVHRRASKMASSEQRNKQIQLGFGAILH